MRYGTLFLGLFALLVSCHVHQKKATVTIEEPMAEPVQVPEDVIEGKEYRASRTRLHDLKHMRLELQFDYARQEAPGKATLTLRPYFYATDVLELDARGFAVSEVLLVEPGGGHRKLDYTYNGKVLTIRLDRTYRNNESFQVYIDYVARPNLSDEKGGEAITDKKGLYFINPDGSNPYKPRQIWTQGETEEASRWFPTIDAPNEKMTQEIYLTVDSAEVTLSNGEFMYARHNPDGTRTDCWKQDLPHSPYLAMAAVGRFAVVKDKWRDSVEVNYYVDPEFRPYAKLIFGNTPQMLEFFSTRLGVNYPWKKFSQMVVHDFVSGAMENTTAVVHGEFLQHDARGHLDETSEDVISHELFHHWFGDLVTCESWANLPLNESFATYGEYLWREHKYGRDNADLHLRADFNAYLPEGMMSPKRLIRYYYKGDQDGMFDLHSYQKGGLVLHMLRHYVGDEAFFKSLNLYLTRKRFGSAEIHDLRMAFEEVTGEDLNWFFNQWFLEKGHPNVEFFYNWLPESSEVEVVIQQTQADPLPAVFRLPVDVDVYVNDKAERHRIWADERKTTYRIRVASRPQAVLFDPERTLLVQRRDFKEPAEWMYAYAHVPSYMNRSYVFNQLTFDWNADSLQLVLLRYALKEPFHALREQGLDELGASSARVILPFKEQLKDMASNDKDPEVRRAALRCLRKLDGSDLYPVFLAATNDSSYRVAAAGLWGVAEYSTDTAVLIATLNKNIAGTSLREASATILALYGKDDYQGYFEEAWKKQDATVVYAYGAYLMRSPEARQERGIAFLEGVLKDKTVKGDAVFPLRFITRQLQFYFEKQAEQSTEKAGKLKKQDPQRIIFEEQARKAAEQAKRLEKLTD